MLKDSSIGIEATTLNRNGCDVVRNQKASIVRSLALGVVVLDHCTHLNVAEVIKTDARKCFQSMFETAITCSCTAIKAISYITKRMQLLL